MVCTYGAVAVERAAHPGGFVLGRHGRFIAVDGEFVAAGDAGDLFCVLPVFRGRSARFFRLSVRRHVTGSGVHLTFLRARRVAAWVWAKGAADAREPVPAAMGMVSHL